MIYSAMLLHCFCKKNHRRTGDRNSNLLSLGFDFVLSILGNEISDSSTTVGLLYYHSSVTCATQTFQDTF